MKQVNGDVWFSNPTAHDKHEKFIIKNLGFHWNKRIPAADLSADKMRDLLTLNLGEGPERAQGWNKQTRALQLDSPYLTSFGNELRARFEKLKPSPKTDWTWTSEFQIIV